MAFRIQTLGSPCLRQIAAPVPPEMFGTPRLRGLVQDMIETMTDMNGAGIAAPQIGEPWRVFVVYGTGNNPRYPYKPAVPLTVFVNPTIEILQDDPMHMIEGCLSIPGMRGRVQRSAKVRCTAQTLDGTHFSMRAEGHVAGTLQHEQDHLDGQLFTDITDQGLMTWDSFEQYHKDAFFYYADEINQLYPTPIIWEKNGPSIDNETHFHDVDPTFNEFLSSFVLTAAEPVAGGVVGGVVGGVAEVQAAPAFVQDPPTVTPVAAGHLTTYAPDLCWTGYEYERNVSVTVDNTTGKIQAVEVRNPTVDVESSSSSSSVVRLDGCALAPGFVNAHSHAFQRGLRGRGEKYPLRSQTKDGEEIPSFWTWRDAMYGLVQELDTRERFKQETLQCFEEMAAAGITTVGEFHYFRHLKDPTFDVDIEDYEMDQIVIEAAREANVRVVLLAACYERGGFDGSPLGPGQRRFRSTDLNRYWDQMDRASTYLDSTRGNSLGAVIHSLRAVGTSSTREIAEEAARRGMKVHVHLEEQTKEIEDCLAEHGVRPLDLLLNTVREEDLTNFCAVHCTHSEVESLTKYFNHGGGVCICPLTEASLGDGVFLSPEACGGVVSLGTDCNARIDMFEEMRWLEYSQRLARFRRGVYTSLEDSHQGNIASLLMESSTVHGAKHLGVETGKMEVGQWADFALLDLNAAAVRGVDDEHMMGAMVLGGSGEGLVLDTCMAGRWTQRKFEKHSGMHSGSMM